MKRKNKLMPLVFLISCVLTSPKLVMADKCDDLAEGYAPLYQCIDTENGLAESAESEEDRDYHLAAADYCQQQIEEIYSEIQSLYDGVHTAC